MNARRDPATPRIHSKRLAVLATCAAATLGTGVHAALPASAEVETILKTQLIDAGLAKGAAAALVDRGGVRIVTAGFAKDGEALTPAHLFEIGSVTKSFAGTLLALADLQGELRLDDPVEKYLPDGLQLRDVDGAPIRLVDLATHRSGLPRLASNMLPANPLDPYADYTERDLFDFLKHFKATRARNAQFEYSNVGYGLLGVVLTRAANAASFEALISARILEPLGMRASTLDAKRFAERLAQPHDAQLRPTPAWTLPQAHAAAGAIRATPGDMGRWIEAVAGLRGGAVAKAAALAAAPRESGPRRINPIGLGVLRVPLYERSLINHDGGTFGSAGSMLVDPASREGIFLAANAPIKLTDLALHLLDKRIPLPGRGTPKAIEVPREVLESYVGRYQLAEGFDVEIRLRGEQLTAQATGQGEFDLFAESETRFFAKVTALSMTFGPVKDGRAEAFVLEQAGVKRSARRKGNPG
jgi:CubicO group peptidase (beta-lactamase class C family)